ncbi:hypothetical protein FACS189435_3510 [Bacteroidia bacterium]|nr:hypothetical protein FACS189435_3510 [Bacteroidia bacterium]
MIQRALFIAAAFLFCAEAYPVYFKHIGMSEGLSQVSVMSIYQDELGRMWFGTRKASACTTGNG